MAEQLIEIMNIKKDQICPETEVRISKLQTSLAKQTLISQKGSFNKHGESKYFKELEKKWKKESNQF